MRTGNRPCLSRSLSAFFLLATIVSLIAATPASAATISPSFQALWAQTDQDAGVALVWGPEAYTVELNEAYAEAAGGYRLVQYFDKGRMELGGTGQVSVVTAGLLATELITGKIQTGNATSRYASPARVAVAGDPTNIWPTYASLDKLRTIQNDGTAPFTRFYNPNGSFGDFNDAASDPQAAYGTADNVTGHSLPRAFADFRNDPRHPLATIGLAITEPIWANVTVGGVQKNVLLQAFERRVLTYTPSNPDPYKVEFGNIGQHYFRWRYSSYGGNETPIVSGIAPEFRAAYSSGYNPGLGNPIIPNATAQDSLALVEMQNGYMLYVTSTKKIYVLFYDKYALSVYDDTWADGQDPGGKVGPSQNLVEPSRGFGKVWRENESVRLGLGYARGPERGFQGTFQAYEHGFIYYDPGTKTYYMIGTAAKLWYPRTF